MTPIFVDTSAWIALIYPADPLFPDADSQLREALLKQRHFVTASTIVLEVLDGLAKQKLRYFVPIFESYLQKTPLLETVWIDARIYNSGLALFNSRSDKAWGLTDCISFVVMQERGITDALTYDHHFEQAGFRALLRQN